MSRAGVAVICAALTLIWGSTWLFIKLGVQDIPPLTFSGVRFFLAMVPLGAAVLSFWQMAFRLVPLVAGAWLVEGNPLSHAWSQRAWISIFYLAFVGTSLAFVLWYRLIQAIEVTKAQVMPLFNTLVAVVLGWFLMGETYGAVALGGGAMILAGTALALTGPRPAPADR